MGLERLTLDDRERFGVKDYTELFSQATDQPRTENFSHIIGQEKTIASFLRAVNRKDVTGVANIGEPGVGKSAITKEFMRIMSDLEKGIGVDDPYAQQILPVLERLRQAPRGDVIAFWNPDNSDAPIVERLDVGISGELIQMQIYHEFDEWQTKLVDDVNREMTRFNKTTKRSSENYFESNKQHKRQLHAILTHAMGKIHEWSAPGYELPILQDWKNSVQRVLSQPQTIDGLLARILTREDGEEINEVFKHHLELHTQEGNVELQELIKPHVVFRDSNPDFIRGKRVSSPSYADLFPTARKGLAETPTHKTVKLGLLGTNQYLFIDDNGNCVSNDKEIRGPLLSYMQDHKLIAEGEVNFEFYNPCMLIINDAIFPFQYQPFANRDERIDWAMKRRFAVVRYPWETITNNEIVSEIGRLMKRAAKEKGVQLPPETMNLMFHSLDDEARIGLTPLNFGEVQPQLIEEPLQHAKNNGARVLTPEIYKEYLFSLRNLEEEHTLIQKDIVDWHPEDLEPQIGIAQGLAVYSSLPGQPGVPFRKVVNIENSFGVIYSPEWEAGLLDPTYKKGLLTVRSMAEEHLGPIGVSTSIHYPTFEESAGPSSSAAQFYALMSAYGGIPLKQNVFMTGTLQDDKKGRVGSIGAVFEKVRGSYQTIQALKQKGFTNVSTNDAMIPEANAGEFLRKLQFDDELQAAIGNQQLCVYIHPTVWQGFEHVNAPGYSYEEYIPIVRAGVRERRRLIKSNMLRENVRALRSLLNPFK